MRRLGFLLLLALLPGCFLTSLAERLPEPRVPAQEAAIVASHATAGREYLVVRVVASDEPQDHELAVPPDFVPYDETRVAVQGVGPACAGGLPWTPAPPPEGHAQHRVSVLSGGEWRDVGTIPFVVREPSLARRVAYGVLIVPGVLLDVALFPVELLATPIVLAFF